MGPPGLTNMERNCAKLVGLVMAAIAASGAVKRPIPSGVWGGEHLRLEVTATGGALEYDCATGTVDGRLVIDERGRFTGKGTYAPEHGGPVRRGDQSANARVLYSGVV